MWKKVSTAISILCIVVYAFAVVQAVYKAVQAVGEHRLIAEREFAGLQDIVRGAGVLGLSGTDLEREIRASVLRSLTLEAAIVTTSDDAAFAVEKPGGRAVMPLFNNSGYSFNTKWKLYRPPYLAEITTDSRITLNIKALAGYIDKGRLGDILRETLLIVLLSVTAAFLMLMLDIIVFNGNKAEAQTQTKEPREPVYDEDAGEPTGMYLGLVQKLHEELAAAGENDTDIVLLGIEWTKNSFADTSLAKQVAEEAAVFFKVDRISAFKRGENGIFIVLPGVTFKRGLKAARKFHGRMLDNTAFKTLITNFYVGLTSCAGREIDPERLILEAEKAVEKAKEDAAQPIVAFKADPSKYKNYLKNKH